VNTLDLIYHRDPKTPEAVFLQKTGVSFAVVDTFEAQNALVIKINHFGRIQEIQVENSLERISQNHQVRGFLYFIKASSQNLFELKQKMDQDLQFRIYLICHYFFNVFDEFKKLRDHDMDLSRVTFIVGADFDRSALHSKEYLKAKISEIKYNEVFYSKSEFKIKKQSSRQRTWFQAYFLIQVLKIILSPLSYVKHIYQKAKISNFVWFLRFKELISVVLYFLNELFQVRFFIRHIVLMSGFKSFGLIVDSYQFLKRNAMRLGYFIRHIVLMSGFKSFGLIVDSYQFLKRNAIQALVAGYFIRHIVLMSLYKSHGWSIRIFYFSCHLMWNYLAYPLRKVFWFLQFQYNKRIKKFR